MNAQQQQIEAQQRTINILASQLASSQERNASLIQINEDLVAMLDSQDEAE